MEEKTIEQLTHEAFEDIRQYIAEGVTPKERATRALWVSGVLLNKELRPVNEEWDICEESRRGEK